MLELSQKDLPIVSGGTNGFHVTLSISVREAQVGVLDDLLSKLLTDTLDVQALSEALSAGAASFDEMKLTSMSIVPA